MSISGPPSPERRASLEKQLQKYNQAALEGSAAKQYLSGRGIPLSAIEQFQLGEDGEYLVIPYTSPAGPWGLKRRLMLSQTGERSKYIYETGADLHLFNAGVLLDADHVILTEGELDAIAVQTLTGIPAVAYPGTATWKRNPHWRLCFDGVKVTVVADGDSPGREAARHVSAELDAAMVDLPDGHDSNSFLHQFGADQYRKLVGL